MHFSQSFQINSQHHRAESFEACCQWVPHSVQIIILLFPFTVQKYIYHPVSKVHSGSFCVSIIHRNLTWTTGSLTCVCDHSCACIQYIYIYIYTHVGWAHRRVSPVTFFKVKNLVFFVKLELINEKVWSLCVCVCVCVYCVCVLCVCVFVFLNWMGKQVVM